MSVGVEPFPAAITGVAEGLHHGGVHRMFGMPGGGPNLALLAAAGELGIPFTLCHGETAACIAAGAYGLLSGAPGAALVTRGPGLASAVNGLAQATLDRAPLVLLADCVHAAERGRVAHQRLDQVAVTLPVTRWSGTVGRRDPAGTVAAGVALAAGPPAGAVHLDVDPSATGDPPPSPAALAVADRGALTKAVALARRARRPVLIVGVDGIGAGLRRCGLPVLTTYQAAGAIPGDAPECAGLFTNAAAERPLLEAADLIIGVGLDAIEPIPASWRYDAPVVLLAPVPADPAYYTATPDDGLRPFVVPGPLADTLPTLLAALDPTWAPDAGAQHRTATLAALDAHPGPGLRPVDLVRAVHAWAPTARVTVDAGAHMLAALPFWPVRRPHGLLISNGLATMGYALPAAIGAALARPGERVVCLTGDGGLGMVLAELETIARLDLPVTVVVFDDAALTLIELKQSAGQGGSAAVRYRGVDFAALARATGVPAATAGTADEVTAALRASGPGPFLLDARIDPASYRHLIRVTRG
ncbi:MAG: thiamine pyrophosphate-binding protein [Pseudonocardia sp.]